MSRKLLQDGTDVAVDPAMAGETASLTADAATAAGRNGPCSKVGLLVRSFPFHFKAIDL